MNIYALYQHSNKRLTGVGNHFISNYQFSETANQGMIFCQLKDHQNREIPHAVPLKRYPRNERK
jgi:hypothetical protein